MSGRSQMWFWLAGAAALVAALVLLSGVLLPFVVGIAVAYLLDPLVDRLEHSKISRALGTLIVLGSFFLIAIGLFLLLVPLVQSQIVDFGRRIPAYIERIKAAAEPIWNLALAHLSEQDLRRLPELAGSHAGQALEFMVKFLTGLITGGAAVANLLSILFITPVVAFYLLRDWPILVAKIDSWLPRAHADTIRTQIIAIDRILAGFLRGQATVCLVLGVLYAVGLALAGLDFGLVIGLFSGLISFVPFVGALVGGALALGLGLAQFGLSAQLGVVAAVFAIGQVAEGHFLAPKLVGDRVGLHPVWIIFALLAGGALFGFLGVLLAVPVAAVIGVLVRFALQRYLASSVYRGNDGGAAGGEEK